MVVVPVVTRLLRAWSAQILSKKGELGSEALSFEEATGVALHYLAGGGALQPVELGFPAFRLITRRGHRALLQTGARACVRVYVMYVTCVCACVLPTVHAATCSP